MLTKRQNLMETIRGGTPDRFVNQFEFMTMIRGNPFHAGNKSPKRGEYNVVNAWGVVRSWPEEVPGAFPVHDPEHVVIKDITHWRDYVKPPKLDFPEEDWAPYVEMAEKVDRSETFCALSVSPGIFEQCHHLQGMEPALVNFYEEPEDVKALIDCLTDWELEYAEKLCHYLKPDALFHHDDWGSQQSTFLSPAMFEEFLLPAYKKVYGYYKDHGVQLIVHHSDSYAATLVPYMIEMGVDIWQGVMTTNHIGDLIAKYGGKISFMGGIDSASVDRPDWTREMVAAEVRKACETYGAKYFIPNTTMGGPASVYPGVYEAVSEEIDKMSRELFQ